MTVKRFCWSVVLVAIVMAPMAWSLGSSGTASYVESRIIPGKPLAQSHIWFTNITPAGDAREYRISLHAPSPMAILTHHQIVLYFANSDKTSPHPADGRIEVVGTSCVYQTEPGAHAQDGRAIPFVRIGSCRPVGGSPTGELRLTIRVGGPGDAGIYTEVPADGPTATHLLIDADTPGSPKPPPAPMGWFVDVLPDGGLNRANLLSYMWSGKTDSTIVWLGVIASTLLLAAGLALFPLRPWPSESAAGKRMTLGAVASAFLLAGGLAWTYAIIVPPLQAADEPFFLITYGSLTNQPHYLAETREWARQNQFDRIRGHQNERFRAADIDHPTGYTADIHPLDIWTRSSLSAGFWQATGSLMPPMSAARSLATVRWIHGLVFALAVALTMAFFVSLCPVRYPQLLVFPFLFVPTLPFFGMQLTEAALLTSSAIVFSGTLVVLLIGGPRSHLVGLPLGLSIAALLTATRSALPVVPFVLAVLALRLAMDVAPRSLRSAAAFWGGYGLGSAAFYAIISPPHRQRLAEVVDTLATRVPIAGDTARLALEPWFWVVSMLAGFALEIGVRPVISSLARSAKPVISPVLRTWAVVTAAAIVATIAGSWWLEYPLVESVQGEAPPPLGPYVQQVLVGMGTLFRLNRADTLLSNSFWMGFGWLDTMPRPPYSTAIVVSSGLAFSTLLIHLARTRQNWRLARLWIVLAGGVITLASYAVAGHAVSNNIHGRYLLAWYIPMVAVFWLYPAMGQPSPVRHREGDSIQARALLCLAAVVGVHAFALDFNLMRYF